jgi:hypothetical protein
MAGRTKYEEGREYTVGLMKVDGGTHVAFN